MVEYKNPKYNAEAAKKVTAPRTPSSSSSSSTSSASSSGGGSSSIGTGSIKVTSSGTYTQTVNGVTTKGVISGSPADLYARTGSSRRTTTTQATPQVVSTAVPIQQARPTPQQRQVEQVSRDFDFFRFQSPQQQDQYTKASFADNRFANVPTKQLAQTTPFTSKFETPKETVRQTYTRQQPTQLPSFVKPTKAVQEYMDFVNTPTTEELKAQRPELFALTEAPKPESKLQQYSREQSYQLSRLQREYKSNPTLSGASNIALTAGKAFGAGAVKGFTETIVAPVVMATQPVKTLESASYILQNPSEFAEQIAKEVAINPAGAAGEFAGAAAGLKVQGIAAGKVSRAIKENAPKYVPDFIKPKQTVLPKGKTPTTPPTKVYEKLTAEQVSSNSLSQAKKALLEAQKEMPNLKFKIRQTKDPISGANLYDVVSEPVYARAPTISKVGGRSASQRSGRISKPEIQRASQGLPTKKQAIKNIRYAQEEYVQRQSPTETLRFNPQTKTLRDVKQYKQFTAEVKGQVSGINAQTGKPIISNTEIGINLRKQNVEINIPKNLKGSSKSFRTEPSKPPAPKTPSQSKGEYGVDFSSGKQLKLQAKQLERMAPQDLLKQDLTKFPKLYKNLQEYRAQMSFNKQPKTLNKINNPLSSDKLPTSNRQLTGREKVIEQIKERLRQKKLKIDLEKQSQLKDKIIETTSESQSTSPSSKPEMGFTDSVGNIKSEYSDFINKVTSPTTNVQSPSPADIKTGISTVKDIVIRKTQTPNIIKKYPVQRTYPTTKSTLNKISSPFSIYGNKNKAVSPIERISKDVTKGSISSIDKDTKSSVISNIKLNPVSFTNEISKSYGTVSSSEIGTKIKTKLDTGFILNILQSTQQDKILDHKMNFSLDYAIDTSVIQSPKTEQSIITSQEQQQEQDQTTIIIPDLVTTTTPTVFKGGGGPKRPETKPPQPKPPEPKPPEPKPPKPRDFGSKFKEEELPIIPIPEPDRKVSRQPSYFAEVRTKGMFVKQSPIFGSMKEALAFGKFKVGTSAAATFKVKETSLSPTSTYSKPFTLSGLYTKGTGSNKLYIERPSYRIKSTGELKEITYKGIATKKFKKTKFL